MKAVVFEKHVSSGNLVLREIEKPVLRNGEVLVKIVAVSVNAADYRSMSMGIIPPRKIYGADIAGIVEEIGKDAHKFRVGDEVFGDLSTCGFGGFAEYTVAPEGLLAHKPATVSFEDAAAVPSAALTALQGLRDRGKIQAGQDVLIYGAGGGVGTFAVQLAGLFKAEVTAVCGMKNVELVRSLGVNQVINYSKEGFKLGGRRFDLILGVNGNQPLHVYKRILVSNGICVIVGGSLSQVTKSMVFGPFMSLGGKKMCTLAAKPCTKDLEFVIRLVEEGKLRPVIDRCYILDQTADAIGYLSQGHASGKVVIQVAPG